MMWNDERVELLKKLWTDGLSARQIASELGGITRDAVIGKIHRLGLSGRAKRPSSSMPRPCRPRTPTMMHVSRPAMRGSTAATTPGANGHEIETEPEMVEEIIPLGQRCSLFELTEDKCRWPIGDPSDRTGEFFFFCGGKVEKLSYCSHHCRIAYLPLEDRRREKRTARA